MGQTDCCWGACFNSIAVRRISGGPMTRTRLRILSVWEEEHGETKQIVFCEIAKEP